MNKVCLMGNLTRDPEVRYSSGGNVLLWSGWNKETADMMCEVLKEYPVHREPADPLVYILDGGGMNLPLVKRHMEYKTDHWLPVVFCKGAGEGR